jgi:hypothetical protein
MQSVWCRPLSLATSNPTTPSSPYKFEGSLKSATRILIIGRIGAVESQKPGLIRYTQHRFSLLSASLGPFAVFFTAINLEWQWANDGTGAAYVTACSVTYAHFYGAPKLRQLVTRGPIHSIAKLDALLLAAHSLPTPSSRRYGMPSSALVLA